LSLNDDEIDNIEIAMDRLKDGSPPSLNYKIKGDKYDLTYQGRQLRFAWPSGLRDKLIGEQTISGQLICAYCHTPIRLNRNKKEVWTSIHGTPKQTAPPIDHHNPSWKKDWKYLRVRN